MPKIAPKSMPALGELLYENALASPAAVADWCLEGPGALSFPLRRMRLESAADPQLGQAANLVLWCPRVFPDRLCISWDFWPIQEPGLCILFFAATGYDGRHVLDPGLKPRTGPYEQYHHGDIHALHISYFRRKHPDERAFTTCNLRKSHGFHLVAQGADPLPGVADAKGPYRLRLYKDGPRVSFYINQLLCLEWLDDGVSFGPLRTTGQIGFRQMAPLIADYANFQVHALAPN
jgi:hypothetical protein